MKKKFLIPPNAVRVWRGFKQAGLKQEEFFQRLGQTFIPATVEMQIQNGLDVYIPTIPCGMKNKPVTVPDETAILFWDSQQTYHDGFLTLAGRTYTLTHGGCYTPESRADFPELFNKKVALNTCYYLIDKSADWMHGKVKHLVAEFDSINQKKLINILEGIQNRGIVDGAIVCAGEKYLVYWQLNGEEDIGFNELGKLCKWTLNKDITPYHFPKKSALWDTWKGMEVQPGDAFNMQFIRKFEYEEGIPEPVAPDSVHVWRGFKNPKKTPEEFAKFLGEVFLPTGSLLQPNAGLHAFIPSLPSYKNKPKQIPDQTALMFWTNPKTYHDGFKKVAVRAYTNLHADVYGEGSTAEFPKFYEGKITIEQPYYLINKKADWMLSNVIHFIAGPKEGQTQEEFEDLINTWASNVQANSIEGLEGALLCVGAGYVTIWLCWHSENTHGVLSMLKEQLMVYLYEESKDYNLTKGLWDDWNGIPQQFPSSLNIQLKRPIA